MKSSTNVILRAPLGLDWPHFKWSIATRGQWLLYWTAQLSTFSTLSWGHARHPWRALYLDHLILAPHVIFSTTVQARLGLEQGTARGNSGVYCKMLLRPLIPTSRCPLSGEQFSLIPLSERAELLLRHSFTRRVLSSHQTVPKRLTPAPASPSPSGVPCPMGPR